MMDATLLVILFLLLGAGFVALLLHYFTVKPGEHGYIEPRRIEKIMCRRRFDRNETT